MSEFLSESFDVTVNGTDVGESKFVKESDFVRRTGYISAVLGLINLFWIPFSLLLLFTLSLINSVKEDVLSPEDTNIELVNLIWMSFQLAAVFCAILGLVTLNKRRKSAADTNSRMDIIVNILLGSSIILVVVLLVLSVLTEIEISEIVLGGPLIIAAVAMVGPGLVAVRVRPLTRFNFLPLVSVLLLLAAANAVGNLVAFDLRALSITALWLIFAGQLVLDAGAVYVPSVPYEGLSIGQIWQQYKVNSIIINAFLGAIFVGIGGVLGNLFGLMGLGMGGAFWFVITCVPSVVSSGSFGFLFGFLYGATAVRQWQKGGKTALWRSWFGRFVKADLIAGAVAFVVYLLFWKEWFLYLEGIAGW